MAGELADSPPVFCGEDKVEVPGAEVGAGLLDLTESGPNFGSSFVLVLLETAPLCGTGS